MGNTRIKNEQNSGSPNHSSEAESVVEDLLEYASSWLGVEAVFSHIQSRDVHFLALAF